MSKARTVLTGWLVAWLVASSAQADPPPNPWPKLLAPAAGPARSIGDYSAGCLQGAARLALDGPGYQVMRPSRQRNYGHPSLVEVVRTLGRRVRQKKLGVLLVGDLSQARGGRAASGHASHQTGLDADVWFWFPARARHAALPLKLRDTLDNQSILDEKRAAIRRDWKRHVTRVLKLTVEDERVERVFVNPVIKRELCGDPGEHDWLRKIRPWYGHDDHFHIRLSCAPSDPDCQAQTPLPPGDGCDKLAFWFKPKTQPARKQQKQQYQATVERGRGWPARCDALLEPDPPRAPTNAPEES
jgi:penicillin-insensitive murein endopeptidase